MVKITRNGEEIKTKTMINWSGDYQQAARSLTFDYLALEKACHVGDKIQLFDDDNSLIFSGQVYKCNYDTGGRNFSVVCYDLLNHLLKSKAAGRFEGTATQICQKVCSQFGLNSQVKLDGSIMEIITTGDYTYYDVMVKAIKTALKDEYFNLCMEGANNVVLYTPTSSSVPVHQLSSYTNIGESAYGESIENMINRIIKTDTDGEILETRENAQDIQRFGIFQDVEREKDTEEDTLTEKELHGIDYTAELRNCFGNSKCIAGKTVSVIEPHSGFIGKFFILNDSHTWEDGKYTMNLGIKYE